MHHHCLGSDNQMIPSSLETSCILFKSNSCWGRSNSGSGWRLATIMNQQKEWGQISPSSLCQTSVSVHLPSLIFISSPLLCPLHTRRGDYGQAEFTDCSSLQPLSQTQGCYRRPSSTSSCKHSQTLCRCRSTAPVIFSDSDKARNPALYVSSIQGSWSWERPEGRGGVSITPSTSRAYSSETIKQWKKLGSDAWNPWFICSNWDKVCVIQHQFQCVCTILIGHHCSVVLFWSSHQSYVPTYLHLSIRSLSSKPQVKFLSQVHRIT